MSTKTYTEKDIARLNTKKGLLALLSEEKLNPTKAIRTVEYEKQVQALQQELLVLQNWVRENNKKVMILFEGRDAAGKGGAIRRITQHLPPREIRVVALPKPNEVERGQWYFQRYVNHFPKEGEIVFFDRSYYNRAIVEPVNGFCTEEEYERFIDQVNDVEKMMQQSNIYLIKFYFSITKNEQIKRFKEIQASPLKKWKYSPVDQKAIELWNEYTSYKEKMFEKTQKFAPWTVIKANRKSQARIAAMKHILKQIPYKQ